MLNQSFVTLLTPPARSRTKVALHACNDPSSYREPGSVHFNHSCGGLDFFSGGIPPSLDRFSELPVNFTTVRDVRLGVDERPSRLTAARY